jgi:DNA-binding MarR family transcriptional regulator
MLTVVSVNILEGIFMEQTQGMQLLQAFGDIRRQLKRIFAGGNLSQGEFFVLKMLSEKSGDCIEAGFEGFPRAAFLSGKLEMKRPMISRILNRLEQRGYIIRTIDKSNRRSFEIHLTEDGEQAVRDAEAIMAGVLKQLGTELGEADMEKLISLLTRVADIFRDMAGTNPDVPEEF